MSLVPYLRRLHHATPLQLIILETWKILLQNDEGQKGRSDNADSMVKPPLSSLMCTRPQELSDNCPFILDTTTDKTLEEDLLADDCGVWLVNHAFAVKEMAQKTLNKSW